MTGGTAFYPSHITAGVIRDIIESVRSQGRGQYAVGFCAKDQQAQGTPVRDPLKIQIDWQGWWRKKKNDLLECGCSVAVEKIGQVEACLPP
jgi:hypothetical protein